MEPLHQPISTPPVSQRSGRSATFALFVGIPAVFFWIMAALVALLVIAAWGGDEGASCNIARIKLQGVLATTDDGISQLLGLGAITSSDGIIAELNDAAADETIKAIVVDIDSPGGTPVAGDEVMDALRGIEKPTVAVVRDLGTSAAYWAAAGADRIIASPVSDVGSIGVTMSYRETANSKDSEGSRWINLSSGSFKDAGNPERELSEEEQKYFQGQVSSVYSYMVDRISSARPAVPRERLLELADGRSFTGADALPLGLIDALGGFDTALEYIEQTLGMSSGEAVLCDVQGGGFESLFH